MTHFCRGCNNALSKSARKLGTEVSRDQGYSQRVGRLVKPWSLMTGRSKAGRLTLKILATLQELPYVRFATDDEIKENPDQALIVEHPQAETISFWLNPEVSHPRAQASWTEFLEYAKMSIGERAELLDEMDLATLMERLKTGGSLEPRSPEYLVYVPSPATHNSSRMFYEIVAYKDSGSNMDFQPNTAVYGAHQV